MPQPKQQMTLTAIISGVVVTVLGAIVVNFVVLPIRDAAKARSALALTVHDLQKDVDDLKQWQRDMTKWKERQVAVTGISARRVMLDMPSPDTKDTIK